MKYFYRDKLLLLCLVGSLLSFGFLAQKKIQPLFKNKYTDLPKTDEKYKKIEDQLQKLSHQVSLLVAQKQSTQTVLNRAPADAPLATDQPAPLQAALPTTTPKLRPKKGDHTWLVGKSDMADTPELALALLNCIEGDQITLEEGLHEISLDLIKVKVLTIEGKTNAKISYNHVLSIPKFDELTFKNLELGLSDHLLSFINFNGRDSKIIFDHVKMNHPKLLLNFRDINISINDSEFSGVSLRFSGSSQAVITNSILDKGHNAITLADKANLDISQTHLLNFSNVALTSDSLQAKLKGERINISTGSYAFWGKFNPLNAQISNSKFHGLKEFALAGTTVECSLCEKYNIQR